MAIKGREEAWTPARRRFRGDVSEGTLAVLLLTPAALLLLLIVVYPVSRLFWTSLTDLRLAGGAVGVSFIGLRNFQDMLADPLFWNALQVTVIYVIVTVPGALLVGLVLALMANQPLRWKWPVRLGLLLPWALPLVFAGLIFRWFFDTEYGIVNDALARLGLPPQLWLSRPSLALAATCAAIIWKTGSFVALILLAALQTIPKELYESAKVDGAGAWQTFRNVTLPLIMPAMMVALIFRTITAVQTFEIPYAMTAGGPGSSTETLALYIRKTTLDFLDFGYGSALAIAMFVLSMVITSFYLKRIFGQPS